MTSMRTTRTDSTRADRLAGEPADDAQWDAIRTNNAAWNGRFLYAVESTGIYCRPSCASKPPLRNNVRIFRSAEEAERSGFRPCKRCKPERERLPDREWVEEIKGFIRSHCHEPLSLAAIATACLGSPYHLHRTFKRVEGVTPADYLQSCRLERAMSELRRTDASVAEIGARAGYANAATFAARFKREKGLSPSEYRASVGAKPDETEASKGEETR
ncbi:bifunctional transcriptional activator/DNA repair enzyme AdaA [Gorillibacterium sp. sgz500922]|uniref:bifunctional transcriptional activator/DNA repair enzyme AdaA n=1 Tax=Gorillibacterium sp. sgz500922 TaxID=3446694 RepID=UPI003F667831